MLQTSFHSTLDSSSCSTNELLSARVYNRATFHVQPVFRVYRVERKVCPWLSWMNSTFFDVYQEIRGERILQKEQHEEPAAKFTLTLNRKVNNLFFSCILLVTKVKLFQGTIDCNLIVLLKNCKKVS